MLTILELAIFGAKIQTNVDPRKKWVQKKKEKELANNDFSEKEAKIKGHLVSISRRKFSTFLANAKLLAINGSILYFG